MEFLDFDVLLAFYRAVNRTDADVLFRPLPALSRIFGPIPILFLMTNPGLVFSGYFVSALASDYSRFVFTDADSRILVTKACA